MSDYKDVYRCPHKDCPDRPDDLFSRLGLQKHLKLRHTVRLTPNKGLL